MEWHAGDDNESSFAEPLLPKSHWPLVDLIAVVDRQPKRISSKDGHTLAATSPIQAARVAGVYARLEACRAALTSRDFGRLASVAELDSNLMHAVMLTSTPPLIYWAPGSLSLMRKVADWRQDGLQVFYTLDAGPTVHCVTTRDAAPEVESLLRKQPELLDLLRAEPGGAARLLG